MTDPLMRRLSAMDWPTPSMDRPSPERGQLWRAAWEGSAGLVVISSSAVGRRVPVMVATADRVGDERTVAVTTVNGMQVAVWVGISAEIMMFTLDHRLGDLTAESLAAVAATSEGSRLSEWAPITSVLDDRVLIRLGLQAQLREFASVEWIPAVDEGSVPMAQQAEASGVTASQIAARLEIAPGAARRLLEGRAELTDDQRSVLSELMGPVPESSLRINDGLAAALDRPDNRPRLKLIADKDHDGDETAARRSYAERTMALAARHRRTGEHNWAELAAQALVDED